MKRPIAISLSPNTERDDVFLALKLLFSPINWFNFRYTEKLEKEFAMYFGKQYKALAVNSGRSALYLILKVLGLKEDDEVAIQALTCVAVPNSILWLKAKPIYIDVDDSFNMDAKDLSRKIGRKTKAIIVQHSFGISAEMDEILKIAKKRRIPVIEDCALSLGGRYKKKPLGTLGSVSFFSFGRDKVISSVFGGMILCKDKKLYHKLFEEREKLHYPGPRWLLQQLLHPILYSIFLPLYNFGIGKLTVGKIMIFLSQLSGILSKSVYRQEEVCLRPGVFPTKLPGALSMLASNQLAKLEKFNSHRKKIADVYFKNLRNTRFRLPAENKDAVWVRFPIVAEDALKLLEFAKRKGILLGDWYRRVVVPVRDLFLVGYKSGKCPRADELAGKILNLPTYPTLPVKQAEMLAQLIKDN